MKTVVEIMGATSLSSTDVDYLGKQFIKPDEGGGRRGVKQRWGNVKVVEFAIAKRLMNYGITVFRIREAIEILRQNRKWKALFDDQGDLAVTATEHIEEGGAWYLHMKADSDRAVSVFVSKQKTLAALWEIENADALIIDISSALGLATKTKPGGGQ